MRVTFVTAAIDNGGGFRVIAALGQRLLEHGHDVCIVAPARPRHRFPSKAKSWLTGKSALDEKWHSDHLGALSECVHIADHQAPLTRTDLPDADIVIATWWQTMKWIEALPAEKGVKVHLVQDYEIWGKNCKTAVDATLRLPGAKIAISTYLHDLLTKDFGQDNVLLLPNAVDHDLFFAPPRGKGRPVTVGFAYSSDPRKGSDLIVNAAARAREKLPTLNVLAFGHSAAKESIPLPPWIEYHVSPPQSELRSLYSRCDAWLFGSRKEGFGLPILEAMACRTPVIGMPAGAAPDLLGDDCGILVPDQDWNAMAQAVLDVAAMPDTEWVELSKRAHTRAAEHHWSRTGEKFSNALAEMIRRHDD